MKIRSRVHAVGPRNARIAIVGMAPAKHEMAAGKPFMGPAGQMLDKALRLAGIQRRDCFLTNVLEWSIPWSNQIFDPTGKNVKCITHPRNNYATHGEVALEVDRLFKELQEVKPNVVMMLGNDPLYALTNRWGITNWRGSILPLNIEGMKGVAAMHPAAIQQGMFKWESIFTHVDTVRVKEESLLPELTLPPRKSIIRPSLSTVVEYLNMCNTQEWVAFDIETAYWSETKLGHIACVSFAFSPDEAISIPFIYGGGKHYWGEEEETIVWQHIARVLENKNVKKIGQNASFDTLYFWHHGIYPYPVALDTMLLHHCLYPDFGGVEDSSFEGMYRRKKNVGNPGHTLRLLCSIYTRTPYYKSDGRLWIPNTGDDRFWRYNAMDSMVTLECAMKLMKESQDDNLWEFFKTHYMSHFYAALRMEWDGIAIDLDKRSKGRAILVERAVELQKRINSTIGYELNVGSPKQVMDFLYNKKKFQVRKKHGTQKATSDKDALNYFLKKTNDPVLKDILELKRVRDEISDVFDIPLGDDQRMHTHFKIGGAGGARWSSTASITGSGTNLQNVRRDGIARELYLPS